MQGKNNDVHMKTHAAHLFDHTAAAAAHFVNVRNVFAIFHNNHKEKKKAQLTLFNGGEVREELLQVWLMKRNVLVQLCW